MTCRAGDGFWDVHAGVFRGNKMLSDPWELELQAVVGHVSIGISSNPLQEEEGKCS